MNLAKPTTLASLSEWARRILQLPPTAVPPSAMLVLLAIVFFATAFVIWIVINVGSLLFGVYVEPVWRRTVRLRPLYLPGRIPIILIAMPVLVPFAAWRSAHYNGAISTFAPIIATLLTAFAAVACILLFSRRTHQPGPGARGDL